MIKYFSIFIFILSSLRAEQIDLSKSVFTVKAGFAREWTEKYPADCTDCRRLIFGNEKFKSVRIAKLFPEKMKAASSEFHFGDLKRQDFTVFTEFEIREIREYENLCIFLERIGIGWEVYLNGNSMTVSFEAETVWEKDRAVSGKGQSTIKRRAAIIHSEFKDETVSGRYRAELIIPVADLFS